jgi:hypothetical protein
MNTVMNTATNSMIKPCLRFLITLPLLTASILVLSGCGPSPTDACIEEQSSLWDSKAVTKADNQAYWDAVALCRQPSKD